MRHGPVTMRDWLASLPDDDLRSVVEVIPALRRARSGSDDLRARIREFTDQQVEGLAHAFLAGVAQRLRTDGFSQAEIDAPGPEDLRAMLLDHLPTAHGRLALHALLIGDGPASSTARAHATQLLTALDEELPITTITATPTTWADVAEAVERLRHDAATLPPALRAAADAVAAGSLPSDTEPTAAALARFATEMARLATTLGSLLGDEPVPPDLDGVQAHLDRVAEEERLAAERAVVREHRDGISATIAKLEADGGPAFLVESYRKMLAEIDGELGPEVVTLPRTAAEARALLAGIGIDDGLLAALRPWPELCDAGEFIARDDVSAVVATEPSEVPELLARLDRLGVLRENDAGELALDDVTLSCLTLLPVDGSVPAAR
ncbi:hypothetical protein [Pseudonocardia sp. 73-21]|uniref:hypothetical protein n=1 Tax=Pseudonocardia sp. 73-21 TaxID=1895809 RepID=UPI00095A23D3|nr:hypothetical protein [Pseudonocardia sp. 73-21]OJY43770.1 MAG: hypothetical protein BGP03_07645 [Pseudonocardia sp. 73-21]